MSDKIWNDACKEHKQTIYTMKLHDLLDIGSIFSVMRVAGGWLYLDKESSITTYVPFNNEFMEKYD